jgi:hypothetical protein
VRCSGKASIRRASGEEAEFAISDISANGALLVGSLHLVEGEWVGVSLNLEGVVVRLAAVVARTDHRSAHAAIEFRAVTREALRSIEGSIDLTIGRALAMSPPRVLVLHSSADVLATIERDLARLERSAKLCTSALEAMWAMQDPSARYVAMIAGHCSHDVTAGVLGHFAERHPKARRIVLFGEQLPSTDDGASVHVEAVLRSPWPISALARALGLPAMDGSIGLLAAADAGERDQ